MTQDELRAAVLAALIDYETVKKKRRFKALKKALQGTMVATVIGSTGLMAANQSRNNQVRDISAVMSSSTMTRSATTNQSQESSLHKLISGVAFFSFNNKALTPAHEEQLAEMVKQLPTDAEITVIGCTDGWGNQSYNKNLGMQRAQAVANYLTNHGVKVKTITSKVSQNLQASWLARRVDIVVNPVMSPPDQNSPSQAKQHFLQQYEPKIEANLPKQAIDYHNTIMEALIESEKKGQHGSKMRTEAKSDSASDNYNYRAKPEQAGRFRQKVSGVVHFGLNRHSLASAHKERLMELVVRLPRDAELTVIGRTDPLGADDYNKTLGMQRAKSVAIFLANQGAKVKAVGSKVSSGKYAGWAARRVDIIVDSKLTGSPINLPPPVTTTSNPATTAQPRQNRPISSINGKKARAIEKDVSRLINRARYVFNVPQTEQAPEDNSLWWDSTEKVNGDCLDKTAWAKGC
jgi:outer membrane protein OmpA-like peptidoglycan-associated protein